MKQCEKWKFTWVMYVLRCNYGIYYKKGDTVHPSIWILRKKEKEVCRSKERVKGVKHKVGWVETQQLQLNSKVENEIGYTMKSKSHTNLRGKHNSKFLAMRWNPNLRAYIPRGLKAHIWVTKRFKTWIIGLH